jgi:hypothetical protein
MKLTTFSADDYFRSRRRINIAWAEFFARADLVSVTQLYTHQIHVYE